MGGLREVVFGGIAGTLATVVVAYVMDQRQRRMDAALEYARWVMPIHRSFADMQSHLQSLADHSNADHPERRARNVHEIHVCLDYITSAINFADVDTRLRLAYGSRAVEVQLLAEYCRCAHDAAYAILDLWETQPSAAAQDLMRTLGEELLPRREQLKTRLVSRSTIRDILATAARNVTA